MRSKAVNKEKIHAGIMENAVAALINYRVHTIVPNVSWGLGLFHEADMLVLDRDKRFTEIEIKISMSDLKADFKKDHSHSSRYISRLVYAVPEFMLEKALEIIPKHCGVISVKMIHVKNEQIYYWKASWVRRARHKKSTEEVPMKIIHKFYHLGCMRIWSLKQHYYTQKQKNGK